jgi:hypothetical protein
MEGTAASAQAVGVNQLTGSTSRLEVQLTATIKGKLKNI